MDRRTAAKNAKKKQLVLVGVLSVGLVLALLTGPSGEPSTPHTAVAKPVSLVVDVDDPVASKLKRPSANKVQNLKRRSLDQILQTPLFPTAEPGFPTAEPGERPEVEQSERTEEQQMIESNSGVAVYGNADQRIKLLGTRLIRVQSSIDAP